MVVQSGLMHLESKMAMFCCKNVCKICHISINEVKQLFIQCVTDDMYTYA